MAGQVYSFDSNPDHMHAAVHNYHQWRANWDLIHASTWPDNVIFVEGDVSCARDHVTTPVDAVSPCIDLNDVSHKSVKVLNNNISEPFVIDCDF